MTASLTAPLLALQGALSGEIWVKGSRRYANPASYLIAAEVWKRDRVELLKLTGKPATFAERLAEIEAEIARYLDDLEALLADPDGPVRIDDAGELHLRPLAAEVIDPAVLAERDGVVARLPIVPLTEVLIETDGEIHWSRHFTHAGGGSPRHPPLEHQRNLYAALLAQACNFGSTRGDVRHVLAGRVPPRRSVNASKERLCLLGRRRARSSWAMSRSGSVQ